MEAEHGEVWAYRARGIDPLEPVTVIRHGDTRPARVLIRFEAGARDGLEEWVPPARLKTPWDQREAFTANEARWQAVRSLSPDRDSAEAMAADEVRMLLVPRDVAVILGTVLEIQDAAALAELSGVSVEELTGHPLAFEAEGRVIAPWPVTLKVAEGLAQRHPKQVLAQVEEEEREFQHELVHGFPAEAWQTGPRDVDHEIEIVRKLDEKGYRQSRELRRWWCGADAVGRWDELVELRRELRRVTQVAGDAIGRLQELGHAADAERLTRELGETVAMLRVADNP